MKNGGEDPVTSASSEVSRRLLGCRVLSQEDHPRRTIGLVSIEVIA